MALPVLNNPTYELVLPSSGKKVKYRPFLVKEQKILMMAQESKNDDEIANAMSNLIQSCTFGKIDVETSENENDEASAYTIERIIPPAEAVGGNFTGEAVGKLQIYLEKNYIQPRPIFSGNILRHPAFSYLISKRNKLSSLKNADYIMKNGILIGCHQGLTSLNIKTIHAKIKKSISEFSSQ